MARNEADALIGPFYRITDLAKWKNTTPESIDDLVSHRRILALTSESGTRVFPTFQFASGGELLPGLADVLQLLDPDGHNPLGPALWLNRPATRFNSLTPAEMLRAGHLVEVLTAVRQIPTS